jgi:hypothetical protein
MHWLASVLGFVNSKDAKDRNQGWCCGSSMSHHEEFQGDGHNALRILDVAVIWRWWSDSRPDHYFIAEEGSLICNWMERQLALNASLDTATKIRMATSCCYQIPIICTMICPKCRYSEWPTDPNHQTRNYSPQLQIQRWTKHASKSSCNSTLESNRLPETKEIPAIWSALQIHWKHIYTNHSI